MSNVVHIKSKPSLNKKARPRYLSHVFLAAVEAARKRSEKRGKICTIEPADLVALWVKQEGRCALSGVAMTWGQGPATMTSVSLDRINAKGKYTRNNIRLVCFGLNSLRLSGTDADAYELAKAFVNAYEQMGRRK